MCEAEKLKKNYIKTMTDDALALCVAKPSGVMLLTCKVE